MYLQKKCGGMGDFMTFKYFWATFAVQVAFWPLVQCTASSLQN